jgi:hypothetical protein
MSFGNDFENQLLALIFLGTAIPNVADNAATDPLTDLYLSLHTADPGEAGAQNTTEAAYTSYARVAVPRTTSGFTTPAGGATNLAALRDFPTGTVDDGEECTHFAVGTDAAGAGQIIMSGTLTPSVNTGIGVIPRMTTATSFTLD